VASYLEIGGMFESKMGQDYQVYNNINSDPFTWKIQSNAEALFLNN